MTKVKLQSAIAGLSGSLRKDDEYTFRRTRKGRKGRTILIKKADMSKVKWSPAQKASRQRMKQAVAFAQSVLADPQQRKVYER